MRRAVLFCIGKALGAMLSHHFLTLLHCANPKHNLVWSPPGGNNTVIPNITSQNRLTICLGAPCCFLQVTHHDIKSSNILLNQDATVAKIADVGTSRLAEMTHSTSSLEAVGTFAYAAPEQLMGQRHQCTNKVAFDHVMTKGMNLAHCSWNFLLICMCLPNPRSQPAFVAAALLTCWASQSCSDFGIPYVIHTRS